MSFSWMLDLDTCREINDENGNIVQGLHWVYLFGRRMLVLFDSECTPIAITEVGTQKDTWVIRDSFDMMKLNWPDEKYHVVQDVEEMHAQIKERMCECMLQVITERVSS